MTATSNAQPDAILTHKGSGLMKYKNNKYEFKVKGVANPVNVTVTSNFGGSATAAVKVK